jgi:tripartite-type tricarboxylate transporter receptor subunit TctC
MWAPKGTPRPIVAKLVDAVARSFADPAVVKRLNELGQDLPAREQMTPEALAAYHKSEIDKWWPLIKGANIKVE